MARAIRRAGADFDRGDDVSREGREAVGEDRPGGRSLAGKLFNVSGSGLEG